MSELSKISERNEDSTILNLNHNQNVSATQKNNHGTLKELAEETDSKEESKEEECFYIVNRNSGKRISSMELRKDPTKMGFINQNIFFEVLREANCHKDLSEFNKEVIKFHRICLRGNSKDILKFLEKKEKENKPFNINCVDLDGSTAFHSAACEGNFEIANILILNGANIEAKDNQERRPLHVAAIRNQILMVKFLLEKGAYVNAQDKNEETPLHIACSKGFQNLLKCLLSYSPNLDLVNAQGQKAIDLTRSKRIVKIFYEIGYQVDPESNLLSSNFSSQLNGKSTPKSSQKSSFLKRIFTFKKGESEITEQSRCLSSSLEIKPFHDSYVFWDILGEGAFGNVYLASPKFSPEKFYAIKVQSKEYIICKNMIRYIINEKDVLSVLDHPFIIKLRMAFQSKTKLFMVMDYASGGDLKGYLSREQKLEEDVAKIYIAQIILAIESLHDHHIIYRDLKPANIVIDSEGCACLTDFGLAKPGIGENKTYTLCGYRHFNSRTSAYMAPELIQGKGYGRTADWYTLGSVVYQMLVGQIPFYKPSFTEKELFYNILKSQLSFPSWISPEAQDFITKLMDRNPKTRLGARRDAQDLKHHPWLKDIDWKDIYDRKVKNPPIKPRRLPNLDSPLKLDFDMLDQTKMMLITSQNYEFRDFNFF